MVRASNSNWLTLIKYLAGIGLQFAGEQIDQGAFACAVLAHQSVDFAGPNLKVDLIERKRARKSLR